MFGWNGESEREGRGEKNGREGRERKGEKSMGEASGIKTRHEKDTRWKVKIREE